MSTAIGGVAEQKVARALTLAGFTVLDRNWRTRYCEIDIVAKHRNVVYFVEVKYRRTATQGSGLDYVTSIKQKQMAFAARQWCAANRWFDDYELAAVEVSGPNFIVGKLQLCR